MSTKKVAIIGAGRSGLVAAKYALENGLEPYVFDKSSQIGGLWAKDTAILEGLYSNISIYSMMFSDHPWPRGSSIFASKQEVYEYLVSYAERFNVVKLIQLNTQVERAVKTEGNQWELTFTNSVSNSTETMVFDFLVIASGLHHRPRHVRFKNQSEFQGILVHSSEFDFNDPRYKDKKVIVLGFGFSAIDSSVNLVGKAREIVNVFSRPYLITHRLTTYRISENTYKIAPIDVFFKHPFFIHGFKEPPVGELSKEEISSLRRQSFKNIFPKQTNKAIANPALFVDVDNQSQEFLLIYSDNYLEQVDEQKIIPKRARIQEMTRDGIIFDDGSFESADAIVLCTGYDLSLEILEKPVLDLLKYENEHNFRFQLMAYKYTFNPDVENLAVVNKIEGLSIIGDELQAKLISLVFSGKIQLCKDKMRAEIQRLRDTMSSPDQRKAQYPYGGANEVCQNLAMEIGCDKQPNIDHLKNVDPELYEVLAKKIYPPANYFYHQDKESSERLAKEIGEMWKVDHVFESGGNLSSLDFAKKFHQHFKYQNNF
jgi:dimethylaniline monooxygenase (N-oxide forming)